MGFFKKLLEVLGMGQGAPEPKPEPKPEFKPVSLSELVVEKSAAQVAVIEEPKIEIAYTMNVDVPVKEVKAQEKPKRAPKKPAVPKKPRKKKQ